jgi:mono/diheme cytochrome c family protein
MNRSVRSVWLLGCSAALLTAGCTLPGKPKESDQPMRPDEVVNFGVLFGQNCAGCHGADGKMGPAPPLNDERFLAIIPDTEVEHLLTEGRADTLMPAFARENAGPLTKKQIAILVHGLKGEWGPKQWQEKTPPYRDDTPGNKEAGMKVFQMACANCHGHEGQGGKGGAINQQPFLALVSDEFLRRIVITGRSDLGMPAYNDSKGRSDEFKPLTSKEINDVVAYLASWRSKAD